jgi:hypothetical protein
LLFQNNKRLWVDFCNNGAHVEFLVPLELNNDVVQPSSSWGEISFILWVLISFLIPHFTKIKSSLRCFGYDPFMEFRSRAYLKYLEHWWISFYASRWIQTAKHASWRWCIDSWIISNQRWL